jgi:hypothetical protein
MPPQPTPTAPAAPKLSSDEFAQKVKAQYPQYANVDNTLLTQKMLAKYPQYADRVDLTPAAPAAPAPKPDLLRRAGNIANDVLSVTGGKKVAQSIGTLGGYLFAKAKDKLTGSNTAKFYDTSAPSIGQTVGDAAQLALTALPVGKIAGAAETGAKAIGIGAKLAKPLAEAATSVGTGYAFDVANNAAQGKKGGAILAPGANTAIGAALPGTGAVMGAAQKILPGAAPRIVNSLIKPLLKDFSYGKNPGRTVAEMGITGNSLEDLARNITQARQKVGAESARLGGTIDTQARLSVRDALSPIDEAMAAAARNNDTTVLSRLQDVKEALTKVLLPVSDVQTGRVSILPARNRELDNLTYTQGLKVKQQIGDLTKFTGNASDDKTVNMALKKAYGGVKEALDKAASTVDPEKAAKLRKLNEQYADLTSAEVATKYRDKIAERQNLVSLPASAAGIGSAVVAAISTGGAAIPAILAGASGVALEKALSTPAIKTRVAAALAKVPAAERDGLFAKLPFLRNLTAPGDKIFPRKKPLSTP